MELAGASLADLTSRTELEALGLNETIHRIEWRALLDRGDEPETHALRRRLLGTGHDGVVYPSFMSPGGTCVALWRWNTLGGPKLKIIDPEGRLPRTPASWL